MFGLPGCLPGLSDIRIQDFERPPMLGNPGDQNGIFGDHQSYQKWISLGECLVKASLTPQKWWPSRFSTSLRVYRFKNWEVEKGGFWEIFQKTVSESLAILCDLFGMVKCPFYGVKWPPTRGWEGHFESTGVDLFVPTMFFVLSRNGSRKASWTGWGQGMESRARPKKSKQSLSRLINGVSWFPL